MRHLILCLLLLALILGSGASVALADYPNRPADGQIVTEHGFATKCPPPWSCVWTGASIVEDGSAQVMLEQWVNHRYSDIAQPQLLGLNATNLYVAMTWKPSNPFYGWQGNQFQKLFLIDSPHMHLYVWMARSGGSGASSQYRLALGPDAGNGNCHVASGVSCDLLFPNVGNGGIVLGVYHKVEVYVQASTTATSRDGIMKWWLDGNLIGNYPNVNTKSRVFQQFDYHHVWDQVDPQVVTDRHWTDDILIVKNVGGIVPPIEPPIIPPIKPVPPPGMITNFHVTNITARTATVTFTVPDDGTGQLAKVEVRSAPSTMGWGSARSVCESSPCALTGLAPATSHDLQGVAYRGTQNQDAVFGPLSPVTSFATSDVPPIDPTTSVFRNVVVGEKTLSFQYDAKDCQNVNRRTTGKETKTSTLTCINESQMNAPRKKGKK